MSNPDETTTTTLYYQDAEGQPGKIVTTFVTGGAVAVPVPPDAMQITVAEYDQLVSEHDEALEAYRDSVRAEDEERQEGDYESLRQLGIPEDLARRLSGYEGDDDAH
jgi:hypothetical protein